MWTDARPETPFLALQSIRTQQADRGRQGLQDGMTILYNSRITLTGIPLEAYEYVVNGKPAPEWVMERYAVRTDKDSGIKNDPNSCSEDPRYILDLIKRIVRVRLETIRIVKELLSLEESDHKKSFTPSFFGGESIAAQEAKEKYLSRRKD